MCLKWVNLIVSELNLNKAVKETISVIYLINRTKKKSRVIISVYDNSPDFEIEDSYISYLHTDLSIFLDRCLVMIPVHLHDVRLYIFQRPCYFLSSRHPMICHDHSHPASTLFLSHLKRPR